MLILYLNFVVKTEQLGRLKFATITIDRLAKSAKFPIKANDDRKACVHILYGYLSEPKVSAEDLGALPDEVLESIGRELLEKSHLSYSLDEVKSKEKGFFSAFREAYKRLVDENKKSREKWALLSSGSWEKAAKEAMYPRNYALLNEINYAKRLLGDFERTRDMIASLSSQADATAKMFDTLKLRELADSSAFKFIERDFAKTVEMSKSLYEQLAATSQESWFIKSLSSSFREVVDVGSYMAAEMENLFAKSAVDEIARYQDIWKSVNIPSFVEASVEVVDDFIHEAEEDKDIPEEDIAEANGIREFLKNFPYPTAKKAAELGRLIVDFTGAVYLITYLGKQNIITPETCALAIMHLYFALIIFICGLMQKE